MSRVRVHNLSISLDGFGAGTDQSFEDPFGHAGFRLHQWSFETRSFRELTDQGGGSDGVDQAFVARLTPGVGAEIMGRGKFGPQRGPWADEQWRGPWGENPPFHTPVFVLTHHPRPSVEMEGGTTFHFIDATPSEALAAARIDSPTPHGRAHVDAEDVFALGVRIREVGDAVPPDAPGELHSIALSGRLPLGPASAALDVPELPAAGVLEPQPAPTSPLMATSAVAANGRRFVLMVTPSVGGSAGSSCLWTPARHCYMRGSWVGSAYMGGQPCATASGRSS